MNVTIMQHVTTLPGLTRVHANVDILEVDVHVQVYRNPYDVHTLYL